MVFPLALVLLRNFTSCSAFTVVPLAIVITVIWIKPRRPCIDLSCTHPIPPQIYALWVNYTNLKRNFEWNFNILLNHCFTIIYKVFKINNFWFWLNIFTQTKMYSKILRKHLNICEIQICQISWFWHTRAVNGTRVAHKVDYTPGRAVNQYLDGKKKEIWGTGSSSSRTMT